MAIKFNGSGGGESQDGDGGDLIFAHKLKTSSWNWNGRFLKVATPGILYLAQEVTSKKRW